MTKDLSKLETSPVLDRDFDVLGQTDYTPPSCGHHDDQPEYLAGIRGYWSKRSNPYPEGTRPHWLWELGYRDAADAD